MQLYLFTEEGIAHMLKKALVALMALFIVIGLYVAYEHSDAAQAQRDKIAYSEALQKDIELGKMLSEYLDANIPADVVKLLASINGHSVLVNDGEADISLRVLFDFEIPYVAELMIPVIRAGLDETGIPLRTLHIRSYSESNQDGMESDTLVDWSTHDLEKGTFVSAPDGNFLMPDATVNSLKEYYSEDEMLVDEILNEKTLRFSFGVRTGIYHGETNEAGVPDGYGTFESQNTEGLTWVYAGNWVNGHWNGTGKSTYSNGSMYEGEYLMDEETGSGVYVSSDGIRYEGTFVSGAFTGGKVYFPDGSYFVGAYNGEDVATGVYYDLEQKSFYAHFHNGEVTLIAHDESERVYEEAPGLDQKNTASGELDQNIAEAQPIEHSYVLNTSTRKFHKPSCRDVSKIKSKNRRDYTGTPVSKF